MVFLGIRETVEAVRAGRSVLAVWEFWMCQLRLLCRSVEGVKDIITFSFKQALQRRNSLAADHPYGGSKSVYLFVIVRPALVYHIEAAPSTRCPGARGLIS
jgi:hypothetical protein